MEFSVVYLETWGTTQPCVAFSTLEFCSCSLFFPDTRHWIFLRCVNLFLLCLMSGLFRWLVGGPCLAVEMLGGEGGVLLMRGGSVYRNPLWPCGLRVQKVDSFYWQSSVWNLCHCHSGQKCLHLLIKGCQSDSNTGTMKSGSETFLLATQLNAPPHSSAHNKPNTFWLSSDQCPAWPVVCYGSDMEWT
jgi:hypothetical protein